MNTSSILALTLTEAATTHKKVAVVIDYQEAQSRKPLHTDSVVQLGYAVRMPQIGDTGSLSERIESARLARTGVEMVEDTNGCLAYAAGSEPTVGDLVDAHNRDASLQITEAPEGAEIEIYA